ncbi:MAG: hypothetical protein QM750_00660 [Rubrivivax sp.]
MFDNPAPVVALVAALAGASAHAAGAEGTRLRSDALPAAQALRAAQVQLYCDHRDEALHLILQARHELLAARTGTSAPALREIDHALWHVRRDDTGSAVSRLDAARSRLQA